MWVLGITSGPHACKTHALIHGSSSFKTSFSSSRKADGRESSKIVPHCLWLNSTRQIWRAWTLLSKFLEEYSEAWAAEGAMKCKKGQSHRTRQGQNAQADRTNSKKETKDRDNSRRNGEVGRESDQFEDVEIFKFNLFQKRQGQGCSHNGNWMFLLQCSSPPNPDTKLPS